MPKSHLRPDRLMAAAAKKGDLTGYAIAMRTGLAQSTVSRLRRGLTAPADRTLHTMAATYETTVEELLTEAPKEES
jgi:transcriptional regulator with XRE-family HTH domain